MDVRVNLAVGARDTVLLDEVESVDHGYEAAQARLAVGRLTGDAEALGAARMLFARLKESSEQPWVRAYAELKLSEIALRVGEDALPRLRAQDSLDADLALVALDSPLLRGLRCSLRAEAARESLIRIPPERSLERLPLEAELILAERCAVYGVSL